MSLDFLAPVSSDQDAVARSPMEGQARAAGARFELRDGFSVAVDYGSADGAGDTVGWADTSHLRKQELQAGSDELDAAAGAALPFGTAVPRDGAWWCRLTPTRALILGGSADVPGALDVTSCFASLTLVGPLARETLARFCALDLRPAVTPVGALRPGSIARQPGILVCEAPDRYLILFGWATGEYMWSVVADAGSHLGGRPIGVDALAALDGPDADRLAEGVADA